jgi:iron complex outermembrane receptor protein
VLQNDLGNPGDLTTQDDLTSKLFFIFGQADFELAHDFFVTLGGSVNFLKFGFERMVPNADKGVRKFDPVFSPRIAVLKKINDVSVYGSLSQGFSPPTIAELYPSRQIFQTDLNAERGTNVEVGVKGDLFQNKIAFDITVYQFQLDETIVIRRDTSLPGEPEYFVNAGKTQQRGIEGALTWNIIRKANDNEPALKIWTSYSYNHYRFKDYIQDANDLSGNKLTGVPPTIVNLGLDITGVKNFYTNVTANYVDHIPVNDANSAYANEYLLIGARVGYHAALATKHQLEIFAGIDNALDKKYSLGNDLNAVGNRYYNVAAARNFYAGLKLDLSFKE